MQPELIHRGLAFDVYKVIERGATWAFKVPSERKPAVFDATATVGGVSTVWTLITTVGEAGRDGVAPLALLEDEAARIRSTSGAWNHEVRGIEEVRLPERGVACGLYTRWFDGEPLANYPAAKRCALFTRMLPALWDALSVAPHGDLHEDNLLIGDGRFAVIDPGAMVCTQRGEHGASSGARTLTFITRREMYPILPPFCPPLTAGARLAEYWDGWLASLTMSRQYPPQRVGRVTDMQVVGMPTSLGVPQPEQRPLPADRLAIAILYFRLLTGEHPFPLAAERGPAWSGLEIVDDVLHGHALGAACTAQPPRSPRSIIPTISAAEDALAMALLDLAIESRDQLASYLT